MPKAEQEYTYKQVVGDDAAPGVDVNSAAVDAVPEEMPDLNDLAQDPSVGAWPAGWYTAEVLEGYATRAGKQVETTEAVSANGQSRNITFALKVTNAAGEPRNYRGGLNYREDDFSTEVLQAIKDARVEFAGQREWPGEAKDLQRSSLAVGKIGQVQKAFGFKFARNQDGALNPLVFVGQKLDVHLKVTEDGFNEVNEYAKLGDRTKKSRRPSGRK